MEGINACDGVTVSHRLGEIPPETHEQCLDALTAVEKHFQRSKNTIARLTSQRELTIATLHLTSLRAWELQAFIFPHDYVARCATRRWRRRSSLNGGRRRHGRW